VLALIAFLISLTATLGVFLYKQYLNQSLNNKAETLEEARAAFEPALIRELTRLDTRLKTSQLLLDQHIALSRLFEFLENNTVQDVQYTSFDFSRLTDGLSSVTLTGRARSFNAVALQSDIFGKSRFILNPIFSALNTDDENNIRFSVSAEVSSELLSYRAIAESRLPEPLPELDTAGESDESGASGTSEETTN